MNNSTIAHPLSRLIRLSAAAALLALLTALLAIPRQARANNYVVTTIDDNVLGSLRQAITDANNNPGPDSITFDPAIDGEAIILTGTVGENGNAGGDLDILDGDLIIYGRGAAKTIIDGGGIDRVFHVCPAGGCTSTVIFTGMTIRNGSGGCAGGGGIFIQAGTTTVDSSRVIANKADYGGGIFNRDTLKIQNGSSIGGAGAGNEAYDGGGILNQAITTIVDNSTVSANTATNDGGGILNKGTLIIQDGSTIGGIDAGNTATKMGGGIYNDTGGTTTVDGSTVSANTADYVGGGIYNEAVLDVKNGSTIGGAGAGNEGYTGGGILNNKGGTTNVDGSTISANTANAGGGILNWGILAVKNGSTIGGTGAGNKANYSGGGIYNAGDTNNVGGITTVAGSRILNNTAGTNGGGLYNNRDFASAISVVSSCIDRNSATSFYNNKPAPQTGTGNWWGAAGGPNTPGADTVGGLVIVNPHLTARILGCPVHVFLPVLLRTTP